MAITRYILQIHCPDQKGLIAGTTQVLAKAGANIIDLQQHTAKDIETFFLRAVFDMESNDIQEVYKHLETLAPRLELNWKLFDTSKTERVAIFVSKTDHCLYDLLLKHRDGDLPCEFSCIVGNHPDLGPVGGTFGVPFYYVPSNPDKSIPENRFREIIAETRTDTVVLARYMQILSEAFTEEFKYSRLSAPQPTSPPKIWTRAPSSARTSSACPKRPASTNWWNSAKILKSVRFPKHLNFGSSTACSCMPVEHSSSRSSHV